jgi:hypothetical protein
MKRIAICILIGLTGTLIVYGFIQYRKSKLEYLYAALPKYNGELKIKIGDIADDKRSVVATLSQIKRRFDVKAEQLDKNNFLLSIKDVLDTASIKKMVAESIELRFLETYSIKELEKELGELDKELIQRKKQSVDTSDKYAFLSEPNDKESKKKNGTILLSELILFHPPYQNVNGTIRYSGSLGIVKTSDTAYLNKILREEKIKNLFPMNLFFAYGKYGDPIIKDSGLEIYAIKIQDQKLYPCPTGDNIEDCRQDFEPLNGNPILMMKFDDEGSDYWYLMTKRNIGKPIAILANDVVLTAPAPESAIEGSESRIMGSFSIEEVLNLAAMIKSGKLVLPVTIVESKFKSSKKSMSVFWMLGLVFLVSSVMAYGISLLIKPVSKP